MNITEKLTRWMLSSEPKIDRIENATLIREALDEIYRLTAENKQLNDSLEQSEAVYQELITVIDEAAQKIKDIRND